MNILLVDSYDVVRIGLRAVLRPLSNVTICGEAADGIDAIHKSHQLHPDIIITDFRLPSANAIIVTRRVLRAHPEQKVLVFASTESESAIRSLLRAGIQGLVSRSEPAEEILNAVEALQSNRTYFTSAVQSSIIAEFLRPRVSPAVEKQCRLTLRQQEVAQLLAEGKVTKEIATILGTTFKTAATHRANVMRKLGAHNLAQMTVQAISQGIIEIPLYRSGLQVIEGGARPAARESFAEAAA